MSLLCRWYIVPLSVDFRSCLIFHPLTAQERFQTPGRPDPTGLGFVSRISPGPHADTDIKSYSEPWPNLGMWTFHTRTHLNWLESRGGVNGEGGQK